MSTMGGRAAGAGQQWVEGVWLGKGADSFG